MHMWWYVHLLIKKSHIFLPHFENWNLNLNSEFQIQIFVVHGEFQRFTHPITLGGPFPLWGGGHIWQLMKTGGGTGGESPGIVRIPSNQAVSLGTIVLREAMGSLPLEPNPTSVSASFLCLLLNPRHRRRLLVAFNYYFSGSFFDFFTDFFGRTDETVSSFWDWLLRNQMFQPTKFQKSQGGDHSWRGR